MGENRKFWWALSSVAFRIGDKYFNFLAICHNPNLGLATKAKAYKGASQEGTLRVTSHAPGSVGQFESQVRESHSHSQVSSHFGN
jgi:hypothetical protein